MKFNYTPDIGIIINGIELNWGIKRETARLLLNNKHRAHDIISAVAPNNFVASQRRDVYKDYHKEINFFFLNYDDNNLLRDAEVHYGLDIRIGNIKVSFARELTAIVQDLLTVSPSVIELSDGEYFFNELKLTISDSDAMGGEGKELGYFYCSSNVDHLLEG